MARTKSAEKQKRKDHLESMENNAECEYEIEKILDKRGSGRTLQYFVKWKGYPDSDNTWENSKDLPNNLVKKYETSVKKAEVVHRDPESESEPDAEDDDEGDDDYSGRVKTPKKNSKKKKAPPSTPKRKKGGKVEKRAAKKATPKKETPKKKQSPKKSPKKEAPPKPKVFVVTDRKIVDNVVHYGVKGRQRPIPIYDFEDFQPIFDFEMEQAQKDEDEANRGAAEPVRIVEKKGSKYLVEWKGSSKNTWETSKNLACAKLMSEFDDREDDHSDDDIEYTVKKIIGKRKNGRTYEYQVVWSGCGEDTATWEPVENLKNATSIISTFERSERKAIEAAKAKKRKAAEKRKSASPKKTKK